MHALGHLRDHGIQQLEMICKQTGHAICIEDLKDQKVNGQTKGGQQRASFHKTASPVAETGTNLGRTKDAA